MTNKEAMTNEEAIEVLKANYPDVRYELLREAVDLAVEVLSEKSCTLPDTRDRNSHLSSGCMDRNDDNQIDFAKLKQCDCCEWHDLEAGDTLYINEDWDGGVGFAYIRDIQYCPKCGRKLD